MTYYLVALGLGAAVGVLSGLFGVGGSSIATPLLRIFLDTPRIQAIASPLPVTLPAALAGSIAYHELGLIEPAAARIAITWGLPGVVAGAIATRWTPTDPLIVLTALLMALVSVRLMFGSRAASQREQSAGWSRLRGRTLGPASLLIGGLSGLLANGGGMLLVPAFILLAGATPQQAAATSLICAAAFAVPGMAVHAALGHIDYLLSGALSVATLPTTYLSARLTRRLRAGQARTLFGVLMLGLASLFLAREFA